MISKIKRFLFGCNGCGECKVLLEKAKHEINNHKDYDVVMAREYTILQQKAQDYIIKIDQLKDELQGARERYGDRIKDLETVEKRMQDLEKDFNQQQKIVLSKLDREKDAHKLTQYNKDQTDKQYKDLAIQNKRMLDIVNDDQIKARLNVLKKMVS
jgi:Rad3-related DNA helicase